MGRRLFAGAVLAAAWMAVLAAPVSAHGDHDARPLARNLEAGPYVVSLWQVYPDTGAEIAPHLIVLFDGLVVVPAVDVRIVVDSVAMEIVPSSTTANGLESVTGVIEGDVVAVTISEGRQAWVLDPVVVPPPPTSVLPMQELIYVSIFLTGATAVWVVRRTARAWRRPVIQPELSQQPQVVGGS